MTTMPGTEIPAQMREMAEKSVAEAKKAFDGMMQATQKAVTAMEGSASAAQTGGKDINAKAVSFVEANVAASFAFLEKMAKAKDIQAMVALQTEFAQSQMKTFAEQGKELGTVATKAMAEMTKPRV
jgi:phasin